jgi:hypothetical protein
MPSPILRPLLGALVVGVATPAHADALPVEHPPCSWRVAPPDGMCLDDAAAPLADPRLVPVSAPSTAIGSERAELSPPPGPDADAAQLRRGRLLAGFGGATLVIAAAAWAAAAAGFVYSGSHHADGDGYGAMLGLYALPVAIAATAAGVPLAVVGARTLLSLDARTISVAVAPTRTAAAFDGATLQLALAF